MQRYAIDLDASRFVRAQKLTVYPLLNQPHRPARSRTIFRDENQPPQMAPAKTLHQRNKSSPALSSLASQAGGLQLGSRRAAFADLSNTSRQLHTIKDDSSIPHKPVAQPLNDKREDIRVDKAAPLQRPAQRPLSVSGIKGFFSNLGGNAPLNAPKPPTAELHGLSSLPPVNHRKQLGRKSTAVLRDPDPTSLGKIIAAEPDKESAKQCEWVEPDTVTGQNRSISHCEVLQPPIHSTVDSAVPPIVPEHKIFAEEAEVHPEIIQHPIIMPGPVRPAKESVEQVLSKPAKPSRTSARIDPELSHEDQQYSEHYFEEDYTTKSRGYTTSSTTILLAPKMTAKAERELVAAQQYVLECVETTELEEEEAWDTSMVAEYGEEIFGYMRKLEEQMRPNPLYMDNQTEVQWSMRSVLMDWLVQVHLRFSLLPETLFLCVNYIDRFLSCKVVSLGKLQLVGATAIFVAAKYEEINCPSLQEIVYMVDGGYTVEEILKAERFMLSMLQFELGWPGPMSFLRRISKADDYDLETRTLAKYFLEITIMDERFVGCIPSYTAAGAHCLARLMLRKGTWSPKHVYYSGYTYSQLRPFLMTMQSCCEDPTKHHAAVFEKYGDKRFKRASLFVQSETDKGFSLPGVTGLPSIAYPVLEVEGSSAYWRY